MAGKWFLKEEKLSLLTECEQGIDSIKKIAKKYGVHVKTICEWRTLYQVTEEVCNDQETEVLLNMPPKKNFLSGHYYQREIARKHGGSVLVFLQTMFFHTYDICYYINIKYNLF
ncbi:helix-turn-helix domain-containing protein [Bacillus haynesii]|uniref:helix-turn-helix domain-containing protein n=1 Tax=Bacillus haynesii TaxID=1925021 RepID=UPI002280A307|nr:helix-turn-helix domain-containing protein [Bacillus haynesii]MCY8140497.1 helix-turn-helix domain-containing protein [Bacillus haynesii]MCY8436894.1 helix-turn-helix domain-containing protein [Bacillus haynesii]MCY9156670.1 helix-turn-helix domain-containing protein [Bacillus haynesii]MCY9453053.1 helix-turn-helix domain-containing protein [Bacillus haynesii]MEC1456568.1 helix-turn-helix domain containing protein [Bacillus haynesii]